MRAFLSKYKTYNSQNKREQFHTLSEHICSISRPISRCHPFAVRAMQHIEGDPWMQVSKQVQIPVMPGCVWMLLCLCCFVSLLTWSQAAHWRWYTEAESDSYTCFHAPYQTQAGDRPHEMFFISAFNIQKLNRGKHVCQGYLITFIYSVSVVLNCNIIPRFLFLGHAINGVRWTARLRGELRVWAVRVGEHSFDENSK